MKKILIDLTPFVYGRAAGYNEFIFSFLNGMIENMIVDLDVHLLIRADQQEYFIPYANRFKIEAIAVGSIIHRVIAQNIFFINRKDFDFCLFMANFAPIFVRRPYLLVTHDLNFKSHPENFSLMGRVLRKNISRWSIRRAKVSVAISMQTAAEIKREFGFDSVVIYNPVNVVGGYGFLGERSFKKIICMSSLAKHKNIEAAYMACIRFAENFSDVSFDFIGNWSVDEFPCKIRHPNVRLHGYVSNEFKTKLINEAVGVLAPSIYEGFGMPYAEAMVLRKCLICSRITIAKEIAKDYPFYIDKPFGIEQIYNSLFAAKEKDFGPGFVEVEHIEKFRPKLSAKMYLNAIGDAVNSIG